MAAKAKLKVKTTYLSCSTFSINSVLAAPKTPLGILWKETIISIAIANKKGASHETIC